VCLVEGIESADQLAHLVLKLLIGNFLHRLRDLGLARPPPTGKEPRAKFIAFALG
jgi:hypothetical protein